MVVAADGNTLWREILGIARHAPSPHNVQPWSVKLLSPSAAELFIDCKRTLPKEDLTGSFLLSAMGMFLEAVDLMAMPHGMRLEYRLKQPATYFAGKARTEDLSGLIPFADLQLVPSPDASVIYTPEIFLKRRTCRISLHPTPIGEDYIAALSKFAAQSGQVYLHTNKADQVEGILSANIDAVFHDMNVPKYHDEITSWFRFTDKSALEHRDGLERRCMNVSHGEFWLSARLPQLLLFPPTRALLKKRYRRQLGLVPAMGMLSANFFLPENAIDSGRFLMRFWLETARLGLYLHPFGNLVTNPEAAAWLQREVGLKDIWLVFKLGYADEPPQSHRRNLEDILVV
jgi:nitroreductase